MWKKFPAASQRSSQSACDLLVKSVLHTAKDDMSSQSGPSVIVRYQTCLEIFENSAVLIARCAIKQQSYTLLLLLVQY